MAETSSLQIFLVENHADTLLYLSRYLEMQGHKVGTARDVQSALPKLTADRFDVLISDISLPDGNGWDLMRTLRAQGVEVFGIAMSGHADPSDKEASRQAGFHHHLIKPFLPDELDALLKAVPSAP